MRWAGFRCCFADGARVTMAIHDIMLLGNPVLRTVCTPVTEFGTQGLKDLVGDLQDTLAAFRARNGFGRGIAAPQVGKTDRVIFLNIDRPVSLINPVVVRKSRKQMTLWDDCFSLPNLMVKVRRYLSIDVHFRDTEGGKHALRAEGALAELLQHEIDHLNGVLAIDRAVDSRHIVLRSEWEKMTDRRAITM